MWLHKHKETTNTFTGTYRGINWRVQEFLGNLADPATYSYAAGLRGQGTTDSFAEAKAAIIKAIDRSKELEAAEVEA
jgi:hypothetical protein